MSANHTNSAVPAKSEAHDAIAILEANHDVVTQMFADFKKTHSIPKKKVLVADICSALSVQAQIDEEIFYPAVKSALKGKQAEAKAKLARTNVRELIGQLEGLEPDAEAFDPTVKALSERVEHHFNEEQSPILAKVKASSVDLVKLGERMTARMDELLEQAI